MKKKKLNFNEAEKYGYTSVVSLFNWQHQFEDMRIHEFSRRNSFSMR